MIESLILTGVASVIIAILGLFIMVVIAVNTPVKEEKLDYESKIDE